jgi:hypothetical protein
MQPTLNYPAILVSAIGKFIIGAVWYSPFLFAAQWTQLTGITEEMAGQSNMGLIFGGSLVAYIVQAYVLAHFVHYTNSTTVKGGVQTGFWLWLGFIAVLLLQDTLFERKAMMLWVINGGYELVSLIVMAVILAVWKKKEAAS